MSPRGFIPSKLPLSLANAKCCLLCRGWMPSMLPETRRPATGSFGQLVRRGVSMRIDRRPISSNSLALATSVWATWHFCWGQTFEMGMEVCATFLFFGGFRRQGRLISWRCRNAIRPSCQTNETRCWGCVLNCTARRLGPTTYLRCKNKTVSLVP